MRDRRVDVAVAQWLFRVVLVLIPAGFRDRHGEELEQTFTARLSDMRGCGRLKRLRFLARECVGLVRVGLAARRDARRRKRRDAYGPERNADLNAAGSGVWKREGGRSGQLVGVVSRDVRLALRSLSRAPGFTVTAVLVLALGIGGAVAIFSAVDAVLLRPLPVAGADRLVALWESNRERGWERGHAAAGNYMDWRGRLTGFEGIAAYDEFLSGLELTGAGEPRRVLANGVTDNFFDVLGVDPVLGRTFTADELWSTAAPVAILSWELWRDVFDGDAAVVGRTVQLNRRDVRIIGVMPPDLRFPREQTELWEPVRWSPEAPTQDWFRQVHTLGVIGRLERGVAVERANAQLAELGRMLRSEHPDLNRGMEHGLSPLRDHLTRETRAPLLLLLGAVGLLLLTASANVGGLVLVRGLAREREVAVRSALGASRGRVVAQMAVENAVMAALGGGAGLLLGVWGTRLIAIHGPAGLETWRPIAVDSRVVLFSIGMTTLSALLFGLVPAFRAGRVRLTKSLREASRGSVARGRLRAGHVLVAGELAIAVVLVLGAGLLVRSMYRLASVDPGLDTRNVLTLAIDLPSASYDTRDRVRGFWTTLVDRAAGLPGVVSAAATTRLPLTSTNWTGDFTADGWPPERRGAEVHHREVTPGYFRTMGVPLVRGRGLDGSDGGDVAASGVVINETLASRYFGNEDPIGRRVVFDRVAKPDSYWRTIVGVVGDERQVGVATEPMPEFYAPISTDPYRRSVLILRTAGAPLAVLPAVRELVGGMDPALPIYDVRTMEQVRAASVAGQRFVMVLFGLFAAIALTLAVVGTYGVSMQAARARTHEVGIRMALGARAGDVQRLMLGRGAVLVAAGLGAGLVAAHAASRLLSSLLFEVDATDPLTFFAAPLLLGAAAALAVWIPARAASRTDPVRVLRSD